MNNKVFILGAGVAGLSAARKLQYCGVQVALIDKGRGVGGRVATRRVGEADQIRGRWDHGAQFATFRDPELIQHLKDWQSWDLMEPWLPGHREPALSRNRPLQGMNAFAKALAGELEIHRAERIDRIEKIGGLWTLYSNTGKTFQSARLLSTLPAPQFLDLINDSALQISEEEEAALKTVRYDRCLTLLAELTGPSGLEEDGYVRVKSGILDTLIDQYQKGISPGHTVVANANAAFSLEWYDRDRNAAASVIRAALQEKLQSGITDIQIHGWKFAKATHRIPANFMQLENGIFLAGDGFAAGNQTTPADLHPRIESAMLSGLSAARGIKTRINNTD